MLIGDVSRERQQVGKVVDAWQAYSALQEEIEGCKEMLEDDDPDIRSMGEEELEPLREEKDKLLLKLQKSLIPPDPHDDSNVYLEIRAGTGGDEAAIFSGDLFRMYQKYAEGRQWPLEILSQNPGEHGGFREIIVRVDGQGADAVLDLIGTTTLRDSLLCAAPGGRVCMTGMLGGQWMGYLESTFAEYMAVEVLRPLGMVSSSYVWDDRIDEIADTVFSYSITARKP